MAKRRPATADEIAAALAKHDTIIAGHALEWAKAVDHLRWGLRTTPINARDWLIAATTGESHPFELVGVRFGRVYYVARGSETQTLNEAGYATEDTDSWPYLTRVGEPVYGSMAGRRELFSEHAEYVVMADTLRAICKQASEAMTAVRKTAEKLQSRSREVVDKQHGASLAYIRGLLRAADADPEQIETGSHHNFKTGTTALSLMFLGDTIDRVAEVLADFGIEPDPPAQIVTRKPAN